MRVIIAVHSWSYGTAQAFRDYCLNEGYGILFVEHPLFASKWSWFCGFWDTIYKGLKSYGKYDLFVGANPLNALAGIILKWLGKVDKVIWLSMDFTQPRMKNKILNAVCNWLDYFCFIHSDKVWNSATYERDFHKESRYKYGLKYLNKQTPIPEGTIELPFNPNFSPSMAWVGHLKKGMGLEMLVEAFNEVWFEHKEWKLFILGKGDLQGALQDKIKSNIEIRDVDLPEGYPLLSYCVIGLAPYEPGTISEFTDPGKVKNYMSVGLAIIITKTVLIWKEIEKENAGIAINYDKEELKQAMSKLTENCQLLYQMRLNSYELAKKYRWEKIFEKGLR